MNSASINSTELPPTKRTEEVPPHLIADLSLVPPRFSVSAVAALYYIQREDHPNPVRLSEIVGVTAAAMTGTIDTLVSRGLVNRSQDPTDRRRIVVELTEEGKRVTAEIFRLNQMN